MVVGFVHHYGLGDNILSFQALYECKRFYDCKLIVFGNSLMQRLLQYCSFVDEVVDIHVLTRESALRIKEYKCDYLILTNPKSGYIRDLSVCDTQVITSIKISSIISTYCKTIPLSLLFAYRRMSNAERLCSLVRNINPSLYDYRKHIACTSLQPILELCRIQTSLEHKRYVTSLLQQWWGGECYNTFFYIVAVNPFNISNEYTLPLYAWLQLMQIISRIPLCKVLVITYPAVHDSFMQQLRDFSDTLDSEITIFQNTNDVLNLVEMLSRVNLLISPSTGAIHVASNLGIPTIGLYSKKGTIRWATFDKRYVIMRQTKDKLDSKQTSIIIQEILHILKSLLATKSMHTLT